MALAKLKTKFSRSGSKKKVKKVKKRPLGTISHAPCMERGARAVSAQFLTTKEFKIREIVHPVSAESPVDRKSPSCYLCIDKPGFSHLLTVKKAGGRMEQLYDKTIQCPELNTDSVQIGGYSGTLFAWKAKRADEQYRGPPFVSVYLRGPGPDGESRIETWPEKFHAVNPCETGQEMGICFYSFDRRETEINIAASESGTATVTSSSPRLRSKSSGSTTAASGTTLKLSSGVKHPDWGKMGTPKSPMLSSSSTGLAKGGLAKAELAKAGPLKTDRAMYGDYNSYFYSPGAAQDEQLVSAQHIDYSSSPLNIGTVYTFIITLLLIFIMCCVFNLVSFLCGMGVSIFWKRPDNKEHIYQNIGNEQDENPLSV